jgi:hypothetical protein
MEEFDAEELPGDWVPAVSDRVSDSDASPHRRENGAEALTSEEKGA